MKKYFTRDGKEFFIIQPTVEDAEGIITYSKILFSSTDQLLTMPKEYNMTVQSELQWINTLNANPNALLRIACFGTEISGLLFFIPAAKKKTEHTGEFGVSVHPDFQGKGIGEALTKYLLEWANQHEVIEKVCLNVFATNENAINLYRKLGFIEEGRQNKAIKQPTGEYVDLIQMYIETI